MHLDYVTWFQNLPPELATLIIAMIPIAELRASIPIALEVYQLPVSSAYFWSVLGDIIPMIFILRFLGPVSGVLMKYSQGAQKFFHWLFLRTRDKFARKYTRYGSLALVIFVGIPLPVTGSWTGAVAAFLFGIPFKKAFFLITLGVMMAGVIVTLITTGALAFLRIII